MSELILVKSSKFPGGNPTESNLVLWGLLLTCHWDKKGWGPLGNQWVNTSLCEGSVCVCGFAMCTKGPYPSQ